MWNFRTWHQTQRLRPVFTTVSNQATRPEDSQERRRSVVKAWSDAYRNSWGESVSWRYEDISDTVEASEIRKLTSFEGKEVKKSHSFTRVFLSFNGNSRWLGMGFLILLNSMLSTTGWENPKAGCDLCKGNLPSKMAETFRLRTRIINCLDR